MHNGFLGFNTDEISTGLLTASVAPEPFWSTYMHLYTKQLVGLELGSRVRYRPSNPALSLLQRLYAVIDNHKPIKNFLSESYSPRQLQDIYLLIRLQVVQQEMCIFSTFGLRTPSVRCVCHSLHLCIVTFLYRISLHETILAFKHVAPLWQKSSIIN